jgi:methylenetetrahydrofolate reductase (NADPH)
VHDEVRAGRRRHHARRRGEPALGRQCSGLRVGREAQVEVGFRERGFPFCLGGAAYPEKHQQAPSPEADLQNLKTKVEAGVDFLITQMFYGNADYFAFVERARALGITVPIVAGIMPITNVAQIERIAALSGAKIPADLQSDLDRTRGDEAGAREVGIRHAIAQCRELLRGGAPGIHFYTLNQSPATSAILRDLRRDYP